MSSLNVPCLNRCLHYNNDLTKRLGTGMVDVEITIISFIGLEGKHIMHSDSEGGWIGGKEEGK